MTEKPSQATMDAARGKILMLHRVMVVIMVGYIPLIFITYLLQLPEWFIICCAVSLIFGGVTVAFRIGYSRCPLCNERYHVRGMSGNIFVRKCMHCGIEL